MKLKHEVNNTIDLSELLEKLKGSYKNLYIFQFENQVFVYHSIGRKDYKNLVLDKSLSEAEKEEMLCKICTLFPVEYNFSDCEEAGLPTRLAEEIVKNSYLTSDDRSRVLAYYREEMEDTDNQINGIIMSAFPTLDLEEVENWDVATAAKYLSRAEWMLHNINGVPFKEQQGYVSTEEITDETIAGGMLKSSSSKKAVANNGQVKLTAQKLAELKAKYPAIDWEHDAVAMYGIEGIINQPGVDTSAPGLRPRYKRNN